MKKIKSEMVMISKEANKRTRHFKGNKNSDNRRINENTTNKKKRTRNKKKGKQEI